MPSPSWWGGRTTLGCAAEGPVRRGLENGGMSFQGTDYRKRAILAVGQGALTAAYYATPDFIASKAGRGVAKTLLALGVTGLAASEYDDLKNRKCAEDGDAFVQLAAEAPGELIGGPAGHGGVDKQDGPLAAEGEHPDSEAAARPGCADGSPAGAQPKNFSEVWTSLTPARRAGLGAFALVAAAGGTLAIVGVERWIYGFGERRAARGVTAPHTKTGLVVGGLTVLMALIPTPEDK